LVGEARKILVYRHSDGAPGKAIFALRAVPPVRGRAILMPIAGDAAQEITKVWGECGWYVDRFGSSPHVGGWLQSLNLRPGSTWSQDQDNGLARS
jgi:hypothetical protein